VKRVSKKKLMPAVKPEAGSYLVHKPYSDPKRCRRLADVKRVLSADLKSLSEWLTFHGDDVDRENFDELQKAVGTVMESGEGEVDAVYDRHSGVRYRVRVEMVAA
jgi:hypothetical protein